MKGFLEVKDDKWYLFNISNILKIEGNERVTVIYTADGIKGFKIPYSEIKRKIEESI